MIFRDEEIIKDPIYEDIFWAFYKELILFLNYFGMIDMDEEEIKWRKIIYYAIILFPVMFTGVTILATCTLMIFKFL